MFDVTYDANNCDPLYLRITRPTDSLEERVFIGKVFPDHLLVGDSDERCLFQVIRSFKVSTGEKRNLHRVKVVAFHAARFQARFISRSDGGTVLNNKIMIERVAAQGQFANHRSLRTWKRVD